MSADTPNIDQDFTLSEEQLSSLMYGTVTDDNKMSSSAESTLVEEFGKNTDKIFDDMILDQDWIDDMLTPSIDNPPTCGSNTDINESETYTPPDDSHMWYRDQNLVDLATEALQFFIGERRSKGIRLDESVRQYLSGYMMAKGEAIAPHHLEQMLTFFEQDQQLKKAHTSLRLGRLNESLREFHLSRNAAIRESRDLISDISTPLSDTSTATIPDLDDTARRKQYRARAMSTNSNISTPTDDTTDSERPACLSRVVMKFQPFDKSVNGFSLSQFGALNGSFYSDRGAFSESLKPKKPHAEKNTLITMLKSLYKANSVSTVLHVNVPIDISSQSIGIDLEVGKFVSYADVVLDIGHFLGSATTFSSNYSRMLNLRSVITIYEGDMVLMRRTEPISAIIEGEEAETSSQIRLTLPLTAKYWSAFITGFQNGSVESSKIDSVLITHSVYLDDDLCGRVSSSKKHIPILKAFWEFSVMDRAKNQLKYDVLKPGVFRQVDFAVPKMASRSGSTSTPLWPLTEERFESFSRGHKRVRSRSLGNLEDADLRQATAAAKSNSLREVPSPGANPPADDSAANTPILFQNQPSFPGSFSDRGSPMLMTSPSPNAANMSLSMDVQSKQQLLVQQYQMQVKEAQLRFFQAQANVLQQEQTNMSPTLNQAPLSMPRPGIFRSTSHSGFSASVGLGIGFGSSTDHAHSPLAMDTPSKIQRPQDVTAAQRSMSNSSSVPSKAPIARLNSFSSTISSSTHHVAKQPSNYRKANPGELTIQFYNPVEYS
ncbi:unnamed protein product [Kuraishia capsulata CBS 1993]|uniref:Uncharacterized protein n=1 Tax=Kuraishia capsulata CBS 1993 TaxID=1382522 RepID=W6MJV5_9ASCO|nr:uncharacterized protein KUCA_T00002793001 [Kuraishia capsulata CBS 1993]CDK26819.1 unnamed protein product [Kuraishia capsulata CBS 1993]